MSTAAVETRIVTTSPNAIPSIDPYLVRGLLWCQPCTKLMTPGLRTEAGPEENRIYDCASCDRQVIAAVIDQIVWHRATVRANVRTIPRPYRQSIIQLMVDKLTIDSASTELGFVWRP